MAVGFAGADGHNDTIQATIDNGIDYARSQIRKGESLSTCLECGYSIPIARQIASPGCVYCISCQTRHDKRIASGYNRRGSKDSQLR